MWPSVKYAARCSVEDKNKVHNNKEALNWVIIEIYCMTSDRQTLGVQ